MHAGVRNQLRGEIIDIKRGTVMSEVRVRVGDNVITSVMTIDSLEDGNFKEGDAVTALTKAVSVVLVKD